MKNDPAMALIRQTINRTRPSLADMLLDYTACAPRSPVEMRDAMINEDIARELLGIPSFLYPDVVSYFPDPVRWEFKSLPPGASERDE